jgi:hypothetical protein
MGRRIRGSSPSRTRKGQLLARLTPTECAEVLRSLLGRHPQLVAEAENIARAAVTNVEVEAVADDVEQVVLGLDLDDLKSRAGRHRWRYVEPTEAAWELLEEAVDPFLEEMKRHIDLSFEAAATATCAGIVLGLYRCRGKNSDQVLGWAEDFPAETAGHAVATLARDSVAKHRRAWRIAQRVRTPVVRNAEAPSAGPTKMSVVTDASKTCPTPGMIRPIWRDYGACRDSLRAHRAG